MNSKILFWDLRISKWSIYTITAGRRGNKINIHYLLTIEYCITLVKVKKKHTKKSESASETSTIFKKYLQNNNFISFLTLYILRAFFKLLIVCHAIFARFSNICKVREEWRKRGKGCLQKYSNPHSQIPFLLYSEVGYFPKVQWILNFITFLHWLYKFYRAVQLLWNHNNFNRDITVVQGYDGSSTTTKLIFS